MSNSSINSTIQQYLQQMAQWQKMGVQPQQGQQDSGSGGSSQWNNPNSPYLSSGNGPPLFFQVPKPLPFGSLAPASNWQNPDNTPAASAVGPQAPITPQSPMNEIAMLQLFNGSNGVDMGGPGGGDFGAFG